MVVDEDGKKARKQLSETSCRDSITRQSTRHGNRMDESQVENVEELEDEMGRRVR